MFLNRYFCAESNNKIMKQVKIKKVLACACLLGAGIATFFASSAKETMNVLQLDNVEALSSSSTDFDFLSYLLGDLFYCRCHSKYNSCMGGNAISVRPNCYKGKELVMCHTYDDNCQPE